MLNAVFFHDLMGRALLQERMGPHLIDRGCDLNELTQVHQPVRIKIGDADGPELSLPICLFHGAVSAVIVIEGLVDQHQIDVIALQFPQGLLDGGFCLFIAAV